jgi:RHS repeat-associated protein
MHDLVGQYSYATVGSVSHLLGGTTDSLSDSTSFTSSGSGCPSAASNCIASVTDAQSGTTNWNYSLNGSGTGTVLVTAPLGTETQYGVSQYELTFEIDGYGTPAAAATLTTLDALTGNSWIVRQPQGGLTISVYDVNGNQTARVDSLGDLTMTQYNNFDEALVTTSPTGEVTTNTYDSSGTLTSTAQPLPAGGGTATTSYTYGDATHPDQPTSVTDPTNHTMGYTYTSNGLIASTADPVGNKTTYTYNSVGEKATMVSPRGNVTGGNPAAFTTTYAYDPYGNLVTTIDPLGDATLQSYSAMGQKLSSTDSNGNTTTYVYNTVGELVTQVQPDGTSLSYSYDSNGDKTSQTDASGHSTNYTYDSLGDMLTATDSLGHVTSYTYDGNGNKTSQTDGDGNTTRYAYNAANQLVVAIQPDSTTRTYTYNADGNQASYTDGAGNTTTYTYNSLNQLTSETDPLGNTTSYTYDSAGNKATTTNQDLQTTTWTVNQDNKLTNIAYSDGTTHSVAYTYDADGNIATMIDASGTSTYSYDNADRLSTYQNGAGVTITYGRDGAGNITSITYASGKTVSQGFDSLSRLTSVADWNANTTKLSYDHAGNLLSTTYPNGVIDSRVYNNANQLTSITDKLSGSTLVSFVYTPDSAGLITSETDTGTPGAGTNSNTYNSLQEVTAAGPRSYSYDRAMNLTTSPSGNTQGFNTGNEICWSGSGSGTCASPPTGATTFSYSHEGNRTATTPTSGPTFTFGWTQSNELKTITPSPGAATSYVYDGNGLLQSESTGSATTNFTWNVQPKVPLLLSDGTSYYIYGTSVNPIEQIAVAGGSTTYLLPDQIGSTRAITNSSGSVTGAVTFDAWGNTTGATGSATTPFKFAGSYLDSTSGFYYLRARWYDPSCGQFLSVDPALDTTGQRYTYAGNNSINQTDPSGLFNINSWPYNYRFDWPIAPTSMYSAKQVDYIFDGNLSRYFPFPIQCDSTHPGGNNMAFWPSICNIYPAPLTWGVVSLTPVIAWQAFVFTVIGGLSPAGCTFSFSFGWSLSCGFFVNPGTTLVFGVFTHKNIVCLRQQAHGTAPPLGALLGPLMAGGAWHQMALNLRSALGTLGRYQCSDPGYCAVPPTPPAGPQQHPSQQNLCDS